VIFQQGDYFGQPVSLASRIAQYARPGEVLVSQAVVEESQPKERPKRDRAGGALGRGGAVHLLSAHRAG
jgi:class 3 adenylate cyclase